MTTEDQAGPGSTVEEPAQEVLDLDQARGSKGTEEPRAVASLATLRPMVRGQPNIAEMSTQQLITWAVLNDKVHLLGAVRDMQNEQQDRESLLEFQQHFAEMQKDFVPVSKGREGQFGPYSNINDILAVYGPILTKHGFSYTFDEEDMPEKPGWKRVWSFVSGYGHTKKTSFPCPPAPENKGSSAIQKEAGNTTYGKRQAFNSNVGVVLQDEDKDGDLFTFEQGITLSQEISLIRSSHTLEEFKLNYQNAILNKTVDQMAILDVIKKEVWAKLKKASAGSS